MSDRCEPPPELRRVDGWHWVKVLGHERVALWNAIPARWWVDSKLFTTLELGQMRSSGYLCPVPTPSELAAAKEREAALVAENAKLREAAADTARKWPTKEVFNVIAYVESGYGDNRSRSFSTQDAAITYAMSLPDEFTPSVWKDVVITRNATTRTCIPLPEKNP